VHIAVDRAVTLFIRQTQTPVTSMLFVV